MIRRLRYALAITVLSSSLSADPVSPDKQKAVTAAEKQWQQAVLSGNRSVLEGLIAEDITYTHSSALTQTKAQFIESAVSGATKYQSIDFKTTQMRQYGDVVVAIHEAVIVTVQNGVTHLFLTHVWSGRNGHWQMVSRQATKIPAPTK